MSEEQEYTEREHMLNNLILSVLNDGRFKKRAKVSILKALCRAEMRLAKHEIRD